MTSVECWLAPPARAELGVDEAAVWRLQAATAAPIESVAAHYLDAVRVRRTPTGRPELQDSDLAVSVAHSGDVVLVAIASTRDVGVDIEVLRPDVGGWALVEQALTEQERERLDAIAAPCRPESFLHTWTRKEAILKAAGVGLGIDPRRIELDGLDVVSVPPEIGVAREWTLADVPLPGYAASVALRGRLGTLLLYDVGASTLGLFMGSS